VWKGTQKVSKLDLQELPVALCALLLDSSGPRTPTVAVAAGSHVYMFQNLRPFYKFKLPAADAHPAEETVW
jgi:Bardet-Biedl syndrome 1 protein